MSVSSDLKPVSVQKTVTTAGTREPLATGRPDEMRVRSVTISALVGNGGKVYVGDETVSSTAGAELNPGDSISFEVNWKEWAMGESINLAKIYLDVDTDGEGVVYTYVRT